MSNRLKKYGMMIIAAVLLVALAFAGAGAASDVTHNVGDATELSNAFNTADDGDTIKLTNSFTMNGEITVSKTLTLDLNGNMLTAASNERLFKVSSSGDFTLTDLKSVKECYYLTYVLDGPWTVVGTAEPVGGTTVELSAFNLTEARAADAGTYHVKVTGGVIRGSSVEMKKDGGGVYVDGGKFTMKGGNIVGCSCNTKDGNVAGGVYVKNGTFNMTGGSITGCRAGIGGGVYSTGTFTMKDTSSITGCSIKDSGGGVYSTGTFTMKDTSSITGCYSYVGGGVYSTGTFTMEGTSSIMGCGNEARSGGGVCVDGGTFTMKDNSSITGCWTVCDIAGGVRVFGGTFAMEGSSRITGCSVIISSDEYYAKGGGVYVDGGTFTMSDDASITGCSVINPNAKGGGVYVDGGTFTMSDDASITGCSVNICGGGVYVNSGTFEVSGNAKVTDNTLSDKTTKSNVYLISPTNNLKLVGTLTGKIGIENPLAVGKFGTIEDGATGAANFIADKEGYTAYAEGTALKWKYTEYSITYYLDIGINAPTNPATYNITTALITLDNATTKTGGYTFDDWYSDAAKTVANRTIPAGSSGNKAFWAKFTANQTTVTFAYEKIGEVPKDFTYGDDVTAKIPTESEHDGYAVTWKDSEGIFITDSRYIDSTTGKWVFTGENGGSLRFSAYYETPTTVVQTADASGTASIDETTALVGDASDVVDKIVFSSVSGLKQNTQVTFVGASVPYDGHLSGYTRVCDLSSFEVNVDKEGISGETATMQIAVTFKESSADKYKNNVRFIHYKDGKWETSPLKSSIASTDGNIVTYKVETDSFSPFAISIQTKNSSGSHQGGSRILAATDAPTVTPTQQPTSEAIPTIPAVKQTTQQTQKSPAPLAGLVLGLGAAAVLLRLRR